MDKSAFAVTLIVILCLATLTLWVPAYWPVALFEIALFVISVSAVMIGRAPAKGTYFPLLVLCFIVLWGCVQLITNSTTDRFATERMALQWMSWAGLYYTGASVLAEERIARFIRKTIVWFGFALAVEAIVQAYLAPGKVYGLFDTGYRNYVMGPIVYHTHFAVLIEIILPIALFLALKEREKSYTYLGVSAVLLTAVIVSASRGGLIITLAEVLAVLTVFRSRRPGARQKVNNLAIILVGATVILTVIVGYETTTSRFASEALAAGRIQFAKSTLHMIAVHPIIGWGLGCWSAVYPAFATFDPGPTVNQAHCDWLQWAAEGGIPVLLAMLSLAVWTWRPAIRSIWGIGVIAVLIHATFDYPFSRPAVGAWPILVLSMIAARQCKDQQTFADQRVVASELFRADG